MGIGIDLVQSVSQDTHRFEPLPESIAMGTDIDAIGQSTDHQHLWALCSQVSDETTNEVLPVGGAMACAHDIEHITLVEVGTTFIIE